jgi:quinolinate synthase
VRFPVLRVGADLLEPDGAFASLQADFLDPDPASVRALDVALRDNQVGVVAHFYMDPQLQGVLSAVQWPHVHISDSLVMADRAAQMAAAGCKAIAVAGVDFMAQNVRAVLDAAGFAAVPVYRLAADPIGCSLADAAEAPAYGAFLRKAARSPQSLHVVYINTSLEVKAQANALVPTITCTSSNVVQTLLQAAAQIPEVQLWYGPDTYMGENLRTLLGWLAEQDPETVARLHPAHTPESVHRLLQRFFPFQQGRCIVHHLFDGAVVAHIGKTYPKALIAAHLEVPGEMFALAVDAQRDGRGVVGSTSNILDFLLKRVHTAVTQPGPQILQFVLGTEAGMLTSLVRGVRKVLRGAGRDDVAVDVIFPVAEEVATTDTALGLGAVPVAGGAEGCSTAGGCATCPYMKRNTLDGLLDLLGQIGQQDQGLGAFAPQIKGINRQQVAVAGGVPILHMRHFQQTGRLSDALVADVLGRHADKPASQAGI